MRPADRPIRIYRGDDYLHAVAFQTAAGAAVNKTGYTYTAQLRARPHDATALATFTCTAGDTTGIIFVSLPKATSAALVSGRRAWDLQETGPTGTVVTKLAGAADVIGEVSRT